MNHQDWNTVIFSKEKKYTPEQIKAYEEKRKEKKEKKKAEENEVKALPKVNFELKKAIMQSRLAKKMSQKDLATRLNVPVNTIAGYENGKIVPNNAFIVKIERVLGTNTEYLKQKRLKNELFKG